MGQLWGSDTAQFSAASVRPLGESAPVCFLPGREAAPGTGTLSPCPQDMHCILGRDHLDEMAREPHPTSPNARNSVLGHQVPFIPGSMWQWVAICKFLRPRGCLVMSLSLSFLLCTTGLPVPCVWCREGSALWAWTLARSCPPPQPSLLGRRRSLGPQAAARSSSFLWIGSDPHLWGARGLCRA